MSPKKRDDSKWKFIFQPSFFRDMLVFRGVSSSKKEKPLKNGDVMNSPREFLKVKNQAFGMGFPSSALLALIPRSSLTMVMEDYEVG